jgi:hypothetical protein
MFTLGDGTLGNMIAYVCSIGYHASGHLTFESVDRILKDFLIDELHGEPIFFASEIKESGISLHREPTVISKVYLGIPLGL